MFLRFVLSREWVLARRFRLIHETAADY